MSQVFFFPLRLLFGRNPQANSKERTKAFLDKCDGPIAHRYYYLNLVAHFIETSSYRYCNSSTLPDRGGIPENTLAAIRLSKQDGAVAVEVDLAFTKDNHPVLLHDTTVDRTSNGTGDIDSLTFEEVRKLDFGVGAGYVCVYSSKYGHIRGDRFPKHRLAAGVLWAPGII